MVSPLTYPVAQSYSKGQHQDGQHDPVEMAVQLLVVAVDIVARSCPSLHREVTNVIHHRQVTLVKVVLSLDSII